MSYDLSAWHPGLVLGLIAVLSVFTTAILISTLSVGLVQWRKSLRDQGDARFRPRPDQPGIHRPGNRATRRQLFEQAPKPGWQAKCVKQTAR